MAQDVLTLFLINYSSAPLINADFQFYTQGWENNNIYISDQIYPSLSGNGYQTITEFSGWTWDNGAIKHISGSTWDDHLFQYLSGFTAISGNTYEITFSVTGNQDPKEYLYVKFYDQSGDAANYDGRYVQYFNPENITGATYPFAIYATPGFTGSLRGIIINGVTPSYSKLDLMDPENFKMNFQIMKDISVKGGTYSFNFDLVGDGNNITQLADIISPDYWFDSTSSSEITSNVFYNKVLEAGLMLKDYPIMYGQLILQQGVNTNGNKYITCFFTNELKSFADQVGDKLIVGNDLDDNGKQTYDLDFTDYNHHYTWYNIYLANDTTSSSMSPDNLPRAFPYNFYNTGRGFYYGFIDFDGPNSINLVESNKTLIQNFRPAVYVGEIWDKIWERTNYTYDSTFLTSSYFRSLVIPATFDLTTQDSRNINGSNDAEFNIGIWVSGISYASGGTAPFHDFSGYGARANKAANASTFIGRSLYTTCHAVGFNGTTKTKTAPFNWINNPDGTPGNVLFQDTFINNVNYDNTLCVNGTCPSCADGQFCQKPIWTVTTAGKYDVGCLLKGDIWIERDGISQATNYNDIVKVTGRLKRIQKIGAGQFTTTTIKSVTIESIPPRTMNNNFYSLPEILVQIEGVDLYVGDQIYCEVEISSYKNISYGVYASNYWLSLKSNNCLFYNKFTPTNWFEYGSQVNMQKILPPSTKQMDFITDIMNMFCLVAQPVMGTNTIKIEPWSDFYHIDTPLFNTIWRGGSGSTAINKIDVSGDITTESIPDLLYQNVYLHNTSDSNDTSLDNYSKKYNREWGSKTVKNPVVEQVTSSKDILTNFSSTVLNSFGSISRWKVAQMYNQDKNKDLTLNMPADNTYNKRLLFRKKILQAELLANGCGDLFVYGKSAGHTGYSTTNNLMSVGAKTFGITDTNTGFIDTPPEDVVIVYDKDQDQVMYGTVTQYINNGNGTGTLLVNITRIDTGGQAPASYPSADPGGSWVISSITDTTFGPSDNAVNKYQPYMGPLSDPYTADADDLNFGLSNYYFVSNNTTNNIYNKFWKDKILTYIDPNSKLVTFKVWLTLQDISQLDFRTKIMIDNQLYILSKIKNWSTTAPCSVELIKLTDYSAYFSNTTTWRGPTSRLETNVELPKNTLELLPNVLVDYNTGITFNYTPIKNYYPINFAGVLSGSIKNTINSATGFVVQSNENSIDGSDSVLINSHRNVTDTLSSRNIFFAASDNTVVDSSDNIYVNSRNVKSYSGSTGNVLFNTSDITLTNSGKTYINNRDTDSLTDYSYVDGNFFNVANDVKLKSGKQFISDLPIQTKSGATYVNGITQDIKVSGTTFSFVNGVLVKYY